MPIERDIPKEDLELINKSFAHNNDAQTIVKNANGGVVDVKKEKANPRAYSIKNFSGRTLKNQKDIIPIGGKQITVGVKGQRFDTININLRNQVAWVESDFE